MTRSGEEAPLFVPANAGMHGRRRARLNTRFRGYDTGKSGFAL